MFFDDVSAIAMVSHNDGLINSYIKDFYRKALGIYSLISS